MKCKNNLFFCLLQCNIAHTLEKTKYPDSDIYWKEFEEKYHFSCQFTADIIAMNHADFIVTSTYQEIAGRLGKKIFVSLILLEDQKESSSTCFFKIENS